MQQNTRKFKSTKTRRKKIFDDVNRHMHEQKYAQYVIVSMYFYNIDSKIM